MVNDKSERRKLSEHEKELLKLCIELATQSYIPFKVTSYGTEVQLITYLATVFTFGLYIVITAKTLVQMTPLEMIIVVLAYLALISLTSYYFYERKEFSKEQNRINLCIKELLCKRCFNVFSPLEYDTSLCKEDRDLVNILIDLDQIFRCSEKKSQE